MIDRKSRRRLLAGLTKAQRVLAKRHGTPAEFAKACYAAVPEFIGMDEAKAAITKYNREWSQAS